MIAFALDTRTIPNVPSLPWDFMTSAKRALCSRTSGTNYLHPRRKQAPRRRRERGVGRRPPFLRGGSEPPDLGPPTSRWQERVPARGDRVARAGLRRRRAQPATLFSLSTGRRRSSFRAQRSHGKASFRTLGTHQLPSSRARGRPGPRDPLGGCPDGREGSTACGMGPGALESEGAQ